MRCSTNRVPAACIWNMYVRGFSLPLEIQNAGIEVGRLGCDVSTSSSKSIRMPRSSFSLQATWLCLFCWDFNLECSGLAL